MKFCIDDISWEIKEISQEEIRRILKERNEKELDSKPDLGRYLGVTIPDENIIYLDKNLAKSRKEKTLIHELTHTYISEFITHSEKSYSEEDVCDIMANAFFTINTIFQEYKNSNK